VIFLPALLPPKLNHKTYFQINKIRQSAITVRRKPDGGAEITPWN